MDFTQSIASKIGQGKQAFILLTFKALLLDYNNLLSVFVCVCVHMHMHVCAFKGEETIVIVFTKGVN